MGMRYGGSRLRHAHRRRWDDVQRALGLLVAAALLIAAVGSCSVLFVAFGPVPVVGT